MGLHLIPNDLNINFVGFRKVAYFISLATLIVGLGYLVIQGGPRYGIDFAGGTIAQIKFEKPTQTENIKTALSELEHQGLVVQRFGEEGSQSFLIRVSNTEISSSTLRDTLTSALKEKIADNPVEIQRLESVGPKVGADLRSQAMEAIYFATLLIAIYISGRFEHRWFVAAAMAGGLAGSMYLLDLIGVSKAILVPIATIVTIFLCWRLKLAFAMGALVSILHDLFVTIGLFALMGKEFDLTIIAALLTIVGYSLNDTIIVYDRIRENLMARKGTMLSDIINCSINQTLSRTVLTSGTTLFVVCSLLLFGGGIIHDFALIMFIGIVVGTLSSIFVASPVLLIFGDTVIVQAEKAQKARDEAAKRERDRARAVT